MKSTGRETKRELLFSFMKAQLSAFLGGIVDFSVFMLCLQYFGFSAHGSNIVSGSVGAIVNFTINRYWSFSNKTV
ncbi:MAG: GtrA family protein, partial [Sphingobacterium sp.]